ncbi:MAG TPA: hypothetical protein VMZ00_17780 [Sporichthya sp.]|nr:hypothetical protein [Sporichthya sp.]
MAEPAFVLLPSPLLGSAAWEPVAEQLRRLRHSALVVGTPPAPDGPAEVLAAFLYALPVDQPLVLVPHSNAGLYVPALTEARQVVAAVFVDAALPDEGEATAMAPPAIRARIADLAAADGWLPPWTEWWPDADVDALFPSGAAREAVEATQPRLPLAYFDASLPVPTGWDRKCACAYLAFGDTYAPELKVAEDRGWPTAVLDGGHLLMLVDPAGVAAAVLRLARH